MSRWQIVSVATSLALAGMTTSYGAVTATVTGPGGTGAGQTVAPGETFQVEINLDIVDEQIIIVDSMKLFASESGVFDVLSGSYNAPVWDNNTSGAGFARAIEESGLDPRMTSIIGTASPDVRPVGPGPLLFATLTLQADAAAAAGTYTLNIFNDPTDPDPAAVPIYAVDTLHEYPLAIGSDYSVTVAASSGGGGGGGGTGDDGTGDDGTGDDGSGDDGTGDDGTGDDGTGDDGGTSDGDDGTGGDDGGSVDDGDGGSDGDTGDGDGSSDGDDSTTPVGPACGAGLAETLTMSLLGLCVMGWSRRRN